ncbi:MAG TPA: CBS domain-containing protein [Rhodanobacteraceae bacterium]|nr:CBS domain-containing protein [Rhodanobacteraceae bacterium]
MLKVRHLLADKGHRIFAVGPDDPVLTAVRLMADHYIGALLVMRGDELVGIVSERDYARKIILQNRSSAETPVRDIMSSPVITVRPDDTTADCMRICTERRVRHLPVVEGTKIVGVVSIGDLVKSVISEQSQEIEQLQRYIAG